ncbi:hypothetical protein [Aliarcobacter butzleri]|uniref:hypothetical protein n=1 Tax=Aliarcobacter butzleri TaxID=28197 RepID=UPI00126A402F|nr:hypothetical protein [Aliarcobacter butzleri]
MSKEIFFETIVCNGYNGMEKLDYIKVTQFSDINIIVESLLSSYTNLLHLGREINEENIEALNNIFHGYYLFEKELVILISHFNDYSTLEFSFTIQSFENLLTNINSYILAIEQREDDLKYMQ